jgi:hypothetical protein
VFLTLPTRALTGQQIISSEGQGASSALSSGTSAGCSPSQAGHASGLSTAGMRLWSSAHNSFRRRRDDREAAYPLARWRAPGFPQPGHAHRRLARGSLLGVTGARGSPRSQGIRCSPAPTRGSGPSSRTSNTPPVVSTFPPTHQTLRTRSRGSRRRSRSKLSYRYRGPKNDTGTDGKSAFPAVAFLGRTAVLGV